MKNSTFVEYVECKYCTQRTFFYNLTTIRPEKEVHHRVGSRKIDLSLEGCLTIHKGYPWDGASGPTLDDPTNMRCSLVHDALYELMRWGLISQSWRDEADKELHDIGNEDGMPDWRTDLWEWAVDTFAEDSAQADARKKILKAPR